MSFAGTKAIKYQSQNGHHLVHRDTGEDIARSEGKIREHCAAERKPGEAKLRHLKDKTR